MSFANSAFHVRLNRFGIAFDEPPLIFRKHEPKAHEASLFVLFAGAAVAHLIHHLRKKRLCVFARFGEIHLKQPVDASEGKLDAGSAKGVVAFRAGGDPGAVEKNRNQSPAAGFVRHRMPAAVDRKERPAQVARERLNVATGKMLPEILESARRRGFALEQQLGVVPCHRFCDFTVGIAQGMADLPLFSGMGYRLFCWVFFTSLLVVFVLVYARALRLRSGTGEVGALRPVGASYSTVGERSRTTVQEPPEPLSRRQRWILIVLLLTVVALVVGVTCFEWYMPEITGLFLAMGILCAAIAGFSADRTVKELMAGAKDILSAALVVGFASGIIVILQDGKVIDSILHSMQEGLDGGGDVGSLSAMYGIQAVINFLIPSATAKAAITIPVMAPFADMTGVSRQAMVLAFQFGDGFTNMVTPTSGVLMAALAMARIPYSKWVRWIWKMVVVLLVIGLLLLLPTALFQIKGF